MVMPKYPYLVVYEYRGTKKNPDGSEAIRLGREYEIGF